MTGNAAKEAAEKLRGLLLDAAAKKLDASPADLGAAERRAGAGSGSSGTGA